MSVLPPKRYSVLLIHPDAVAAGLVALHQFETIPSRHDEIIQATRRVNQLQLPLRYSPQLARNASRDARVPLPKQVGRRLIVERLNHS
jgi:hypothetical protein